MSPLAHQSPLPPFAVLDLPGALEVHGEIDVAGGPELRAALERAVDRGTAVLVDLRPCTFMDCAGLAALVAARDRADRRDVPFAIVCGAGDAAQRLFDVAAPGLLMTFPDRATAADADPDAALRRWTSGTA